MATIKQLQKTLQLTFGIVPVVAGLDKFTNLLTNWSDYLSAGIKYALPLDAGLFMKGIGIVEIVAGLLVFLRPLIGAYVVMIWLTCIALQLIAGMHYFDVAVRDLVMAISAFVLAQLTAITKSTK
jgi:hypothetical protein